MSRAADPRAAERARAEAAQQSVVDPCPLEPGARSLEPLSLTTDT